MQTQPLSSTPEASPHPTPVEIWQQLLIYLLKQHYGLSLKLSTTGKSDPPCLLRINFRYNSGLASAVAFLLPDEEVSLEVQSRFRQGWSA